MASQIRTLKIQAYEDALEKQKLELDYMQLQIEPHFYLNALNLSIRWHQAEDVELIGGTDREPFSVSPLYCQQSEWKNDGSGRKQAYRSLPEDYGDPFRRKFPIHSGD